MSGRTQDVVPDGSHNTGKADGLTTGRIGATIAIAAALMHATQVVAGDWAWAGVVAFAIAAGWLLGWRLDVLRSVRTAVVLLATLTIACVLGTLTVQRQHLSHATDEEFEQTLSFAWAHLAVKITHPIPAAVEIPPEQVAHLDRMEQVFGAEVAGEQRDKLVKSLRNQQSEQRAHDLALSHPGIFAALVRAANGLKLTDVFRAWWFVGLFYMLALNLVVGALMRRKVSVRNLGFHSAHLGLVLVVVGATGSAFVGERGFVALTVGDDADAYRDRSNGNEVPLGFSVRLDRFDTLYHEDLTVSVLTADAPASNPHHGMMGGGGEASLTHSLKVQQGKTTTLADPVGGESYDITMAEIAEGIGLERTYEPALSGDGESVAVVRFTAPGQSEQGLWLSASDALFIDPANRFKVRVDAAAAMAAAPLSCEDVEGAGTFTITATPGAPPISRRVVEGAAVSAGSLTATFLQVIPDFRVGVATHSLQDYPRNPALRVRLTDEQGQGGDYLFFAAESLRDFTQLPWSGVEAAFDYDYWCSPTGTRVQLMVSDDGTAEALVSGSDAPPERRRVDPGQSLELRDGAGDLRLLEVLAAAQPTTQLVRDMPQDALADMPTRTALRLEIAQDGHSSERWLLANSTAGEMRLGDGPGGLALSLGDNLQRPPRDWRSELSIVEEGRVVASGTVEVNTPLCYHGYCFFQSDADASRPTYSGLQVMRDPAWMPVKTGLWMLLLGISWCFYLQPVFDRRAARARKGRAATAPATAEAR